MNLGFGIADFVRLVCKPVPRNLARGYFHAKIPRKGVVTLWTFQPLNAYCLWTVGRRDATLCHTHFMLDPLSIVLAAHEDVSSPKHTDIIRRMPMPHQSLILRMSPSTTYPLTTPELPPTQPSSNCNPRVNISSILNPDP